MALILGLLAAAPAAAASGCPKDPGTAAVNQYCEFIPGDVASPPSHGHGHGNGGGPTPVPSSTADTVRGQRGGGAVLSGLSGEPATSSAPGSSAAPSRGHAKPAAPRHAGKHGRQGQPAGITRAAVEPAPKGALAAVSSSAGSLFSGEIGSLLALLVAVTLGGALAVLVRRRAKAD